MTGCQHEVSAAVGSERKRGLRSWPHGRKPASRSCPTIENSARPPGEFVRSGLIPQTAATAGDSFAQLRRTVMSLPTDLGTETNSRNRLLIQRLGHASCALELLNQVLTDDNLLGEIAARSYRHTNHFDKIVLVGSDNPVSYRLTLHLWMPPYTAAELSDELIHDHRFSFWSAILAGTLISENFKRSHAGTRFRQYRYVPELRSQTFQDIYEFAGEATLAKSGVSSREAGESYYLPAPSIHRVVLPAANLTCSLVLRGPRLRNFSTVFNTAYPGTDVRYANAMFSTRTLSIKIAAIADALRKTSNGPAPPLPLTATVPATETAP